MILFCRFCAFCLAFGKAKGAKSAKIFSMTQSKILEQRL